MNYGRKTDFELLREHTVANLLPLDFDTQERIAKHYWRGRRDGLTHVQAKKYALGFENPAWVYLAFLALQALFAILRLIWEKRNGRSV